MYTLSALSVTDVAKLNVHDTFTHPSVDRTVAPLRRFWTFRFEHFDALVPLSASVAAPLTLPNDVALKSLCQQLQKKGGNIDDVLAE